MQCIATSAWESLESMRATEGPVGPLRERVGEILGATPEVEEWEIAVLHRDHRTSLSACVRTTWLKIDPAGLDRVIDVNKLVSLPAMEELEGFCSASLSPTAPPGGRCRR